VKSEKGTVVAPAKHGEAVKKIIAVGKGAVSSASVVPARLNKPGGGLTQACRRRLGSARGFRRTQSVQLPGGLGPASGGRRRNVESLAGRPRPWGCDGSSLRTIPNPAKASADRPQMVTLRTSPSVQRVLDPSPDHEKTAPTNAREGRASASDQEVKNISHGRCAESAQGRL